MTQFGQFSKLSTKQGIDSDKGIISGVSVISTGEALGHDLIIDDLTLRQVVKQAAQYGDGLKVRFNHPGKGNDASVLSSAGVLKNFRLDGDRVRADLHLLKSDSNFSKIVEMATLMPENFGLSIVFSGENEKSHGKTLARCSEIYACDLVDDPAANPTGLFAKPNEGNSMLDKFKTQLGKIFGFDPEKATEEEIQTALSKKEEELKKKEKKKKEEPEEEEEDEMCKMAKLLDSKLAPITTELAALKAKDDAAVALAKKNEIDSLLAEASRDGRVVPIDNADLYEAKDGKITIKQEPSFLRKMIEKLPKAQVQLSRRADAPKDKEGRELSRGSAEFGSAMRNARERGAAQLTQSFTEKGLN